MSVENTPQLVRDPPDLGPYERRVLDLMENRSIEDEVSRDLVDDGSALQRKQATPATGGSSSSTERPLERTRDRAPRRCSDRRSRRRAAETDH